MRPSSRRWPWLQWLVVGVFAGLLATVSAGEVSVTSHKRFGKAHYISHTLVVIRKQQVVVSEDNGATFTTADGLDGVNVTSLHIDEYVESRAFIFDDSGGIAVTHDYGHHWHHTELVSPSEKGYKIQHGRQVQFHATNPDLILASISVCDDDTCYYLYHYSDDGGHHWSRMNVTYAESCVFLGSSPEFAGGTDRSVVCGTNRPHKRNHYSTPQYEGGVWRSDDWFQSRHPLSPSVVSQGKIDQVVVKLQFLVVVMTVMWPGSEQFRRMVLVSTSGDSLHLSDVNVDDVDPVVVAGTPQSVWLAVPQNRVSARWYAVDATGVRFHPLLVNVSMSNVLRAPTTFNATFVNVDEGGRNHERQRTQYTVDDGRTWHRLIVDPDSEEGQTCRPETQCYLNIGRVDSLLAAPAGIMMAVGNIRRDVDPEQGLDQTWVSRDGGATWRMALGWFSSYASANYGNVLVALGHRLNCYYSVDHGWSWHQLMLPDNFRVSSYIKVVTARDGSALSFVVSSDDQVAIFDFSNVFDGKVCQDTDMEIIEAKDDRGEPLCHRGVKQRLRRRKADAQCFVGHLHEFMVAEEYCECSTNDYECAPGFRPLTNVPGLTCVPDRHQLKELCRDDRNKTLRLPDKQRIAGNKCRNQSVIISTAEFDCRNHTAIISPEGIAQFSTNLPGAVTDIVPVRNVVAAFDNPDEFVGNNLFFQIENGTVYVSHDGGDTIARVDIADDIWSIYHEGVPGVVVMVGSNSTYFSEDGGRSFTTREVPSAPMAGGGQVVLSPTHFRQLLWYGCHAGSECDVRDVWLSDDFGATFQPVVTNAHYCQVIRLDEESGYWVMCSVDKGKNRLDVVYFSPPFNKANVWLKRVADFTVVGPFVVAAVFDGKAGVYDYRSSLPFQVTRVQGNMFDRLDRRVSVKNSDSCRVSLPTRSREMARVVDGESGSLILFHPTNHEQGALVKSDSRGTAYDTILTNVSCDSEGNVGFARVKLMPGTLLANQVADRQSQRVRTMISYDDGWQWVPLTPPALDSHHRPYNCSGSCSLHLDITANLFDNYEPMHAAGIIVATGTVGTSSEATKSTFFSADGGWSWQEVANDTMHWAIGELGSIVVLVDNHHPTRELQYSEDYGDTWQRYQFVDTPRLVHQVSVSRGNDGEFKFVLVVNQTEVITEVITVNFNGRFARQCANTTTDTDFEYWIPPYYANGTSCIYGHTPYYLRKIKHRQCFVAKPPWLMDWYKKSSCRCTKRDYECDDDYMRDPTDNTCKPKPDLSPKQLHDRYCAASPYFVYGGSFQFRKPTGYRQVPMSLCHGSYSDYVSSEEIWCQGKSRHRSRVRAYLIGGIVGGVSLIVVMVGFYIVWHLKLHRINKTIEASDDDDDATAGKRGQAWVAGVFANVRGWLKSSPVQPLETIELSDDITSGSTHSNVKENVAEPITSGQEPRPANEVHP